jgi:predicted RNase H-like nuclease (RuvC/YqgF family)
VEAVTRAPRTSAARSSERRATCTARVPDNGDCYECGSEALRSNRCAEHLQHEVREIVATVRRKRREIAVLEERLRELQTESG